MNSKQSFRKMKRSMKTAVLLAVLIAAAVLALLTRFGVFSLHKQPAAPDAATSVRFIDVGQGDCTLAVSDGEAMLIDSGESDERDRVISYIKSLGIKRLEHIIVTHPHSDHMGEMADIINSFEVGQVTMPLLPEELILKNYSYEKLTKAAERNGVRLTAACNESFQLGGMKVITFVPEEYTEDLNNDSVVVMLKHGDNSFLVTGDCGKAEEEQLLRQGADLGADVLKVGHHGSSSASSELFLAAVRPMYAVISCGAANDYGHPHEQTLIRLKTFTDKIYTTRDSGTVTFVSDGKGMTVYTEKQDTANS